MKIGYTRVSSADQNLERQIIKMKELGIEERFIFQEKASGKNFERQQYQDMKRTLRAGDILYIDSLDRLGRNYDGIISEWKDITMNIHAHIICLDNQELFNSQKWQQMGDVGKVLQDTILSLLAYVAETERKKILRRQADGIAIAKKNGKYKGRSPIPVDKTAFQVEYTRWKAGEQTARLAMNHLNLKDNTFYRRVKAYEAGKLF
ncbi:recombinase family protein [Butyrivibrio sp. AC2005]|uniref:recombinase family protein n=1 Tax=Butyrivibrio sp. AC2005 TaxID=1280672 RepID=UPI000400AC00|nr:recombinase family protein [Butyrivibrio sp. AC2005]